MKYIELFAGVGGFRSALDALGMECIFASEIDKYAKKSYNTLYGGQDLHDDITKIDVADIPDHDLLVGGFPCQAFSLAGQRKGFEDTRGTLFFEIVRIAKEKRPKWLLLENVKGLLSHDKGNTFEVMCKALNEIGYAIDFQVLNSKHYGVPQNRERIFIVANRDAEHEDWTINGNDVVAKAKRRVRDLGIRTFNFKFPTNNTVDKRLRDVLQENVDEKFYLSAEKTAKLIHQLNIKPSNEAVAIDDYNGNIAPQNGEITTTLTHNCGSTALRTGIKIAEPQVNVIGSLEYYNFDCMNRVHDADGLSPTIQTLQGGSREPKIAVETVRLNKNELKNKTDLSHSIMARDYKGLANQDMVGVIELNQIDWIPNSDQVARTLRTGGADTLTAKHNCDHVHDGYRIRKLTPLECFRLQGFTDEQFYKLKEAGISDSQIYKQAGNAVTVNVIDALGKALLAYETNDSKRNI